MSTDLKTAIAENNDDVHVTSFFGGTERGRCIQLTNGATGDHIQLTKAQMVDLISTMCEWLADT